MKDATNVPAGKTVMPLVALFVVEPLPIVNSTVYVPVAVKV